MVRGFAQYLSAEDTRTEIPPQGLLPYCYRRCSPYIYRDEQIKQLIEAAQQLPSPIGLRPYTYLFDLVWASCSNGFEDMRVYSAQMRRR